MALLKSSLQKRRHQEQTLLLHEAPLLQKLVRNLSPQWEHQAPLAKNKLF